jgi:acetylornithine aminotransferase
VTLERQQQLEARYLMTTYARKPVQFVRGLGMELFDSEGRRYLDFLAGIGAVSVGHCHPLVTAALVAQAQTLVHVGNYYYLQGRGELAERLSELLSSSAATAAAVAGADKTAAEPAAATASPAEPATAAEPPAAATTATPPALSAPPAASTSWRSFFTNSGTEAVEAALKIARKHGRERLGGAYTVISAQRSFHGRSMGALAATGQSVKQEAFNPMPDGFRHVAFNDLEALLAALDDTDKAPCAVLLECIQGEGGVWPHSRAYLQALRAETAKRNVALLIDEVQTGFYRTGSYPFAFAHFGIVPDVVALAKGIGNGMPLGAVCAQGDFAELLQPGEHGSTFGGSCLAIAAALATLDVLSSDELAAAVTRTGDYLRQQLARLPHIGAVRGMGLMLAADLDCEQAPALVDAALAQGFVLNATGPHTLRFLPPLICEKAQVDELISALKELLGKIEK